jgi:hypothetical protein
VPQVDNDGNDLGGVRLPQLEVPLATYTGWNLRDPKIGMPDERVSFLGSFFPLPKTKADAEAAAIRASRLRSGIPPARNTWRSSVRLRIDSLTIDFC